MRESVSFRRLKRTVDRRRISFKKDDEKGTIREIGGIERRWRIVERFFDAEAIQNVVEAATINGAEPNTFLKRMLKKTGSRNLRQLIKRHADETGP